jgi:ubiquinone/menaquinone biosynthesis C-methylase UbiE
MKFSTTTRRRLLALVFIALFSTASVGIAKVFSQEQSSSEATEAKSDAAAAEVAKAKIPPALETYMGREIAKTMHYSGAPWLIRDEREREERCSLMLANLGVRPQMVICDMGCGVGFHSTKMAQMTGPKGYVAGVDVQPQMLNMMRKRMEQEGIENIIPILGSYHNPRLPRDTFHMVLMVDVYHEFSHPEQMLAAIRKSLKPDGLVVLVEYRAEDKTVPIKPEHKMSKEQVDKELTANGFKLVKSYDKLPWQHMLFYGRADEREK